MKARKLRQSGRAQADGSVCDGANLPNELEPVATPHKEQEVFEGAHARL